MITYVIFMLLSIIRKKSIELNVCIMENKELNKLLESKLCPLHDSNETLEDSSENSDCCK
jgi:hypothetical protein